MRIVLAVLLLSAACGPRQVVTFTPKAVACHALETASPGAAGKISGSSLGSTAVPPPTHYPDVFDTKPAQALPKNELAWGVYSYARTDPHQVSDANLTAFAQLIEKKSKKPVRVVADPTQLEPKADATQVLVNQRFGASLATFVLPPGWDPSSKVPILFSGNPSGSSNNSRLFGGGSYGAQYALLTSISEGRLITVIHNAGGVPSQGTSPQVLDDVGCAIEWLDASFGGDAQRVVFTGKSRGGSTALLWGENPREHPYRTVGIFAHVPAWLVSPALRSTVSLFPDIGFGLAETLFTEDAFYPTSHPGEAELHQRIIEIDSPDNRLESLDATHPVAYLEKLRSVEALSVCLGTHDSQIYLPLSMQMLADLEGAGIPHRAEVMIRGGHVDCPGQAQALQDYLQGLVGLGPQALPKPGRVFDLAPPLGEAGEAVPLDFGGRMPWVGQIQARVMTSAQGQAVLCGPGGDVHVSLPGVVDLRKTVSEGCELIDFTAPATPGTLQWTFELPSGDAAGGAIAPGHSLETVVTSAKDPKEQWFWNPNDPRVAGFAALP